MQARVLPQVAELTASADGSRERRHLPGEDTEERRLPRAVPADDADLLPQRAT